MRYSMIKHIIQKELKDIFRDKKTIFTMIILPVLLYPLLMVGGAQIGTLVAKEMHESVFKVAVAKEIPEKIIDLIEKEEQLTLIDVEDYEKELNDESIQGYLALENQKDNQFVIYYNASKDDSSRTKEILENLLKDYKTILVKESIKSAGMDIEEVLEPIAYGSKNIAKNEDMAGYFLAMILPFILIIGIASGAIYPAIDVMAGEKERGTIETLLTLPVSNLELIVGKYVAVALVALMSALLNLLSIGASIALMIGSIGMMEGMGDMAMPGFAMGQFVLPLMITIIAVFLFTLVVVAMSMSICALAKSFKEAQNYITPMLFIIMIPSYVTMVPTIELTTVTASIPIVNIALILKSVLQFKYDIGLMGIVLVSNIALVILSIFILIKLFDSEEILFGSGKEFAILQRRYNIQKGTMPTPSDALMIYAVALLLLIYIGQWLQYKFGFLGIALTQFVLVGIALGFAFYMKTDWKKTFSLKAPRILELLGAIVLWVGTFIIAMVLAEILLPMSSVNEETVEALSQALAHDNLLINLVVVALLPALCEEFLFRGVIYKGLENEKHGRRAVVISALLFGFMHMDFIRIPITTLLGLALGYVVYKTGSIWIAMFIHFLNNGFAVVVEHLSKREIHLGLPFELPLLGWAIVGIVMIGIGTLFFRNKLKRE